MVFVFRSLIVNPIKYIYFLHILAYNFDEDEIIKTNYKKTFHQNSHYIPFILEVKNCLH